MSAFADIPVLGLNPLIEGGDISALTSDFARAYGETGFAYVINHGIDREVSPVRERAFLNFRIACQRCPERIPFFPVDRCISNFGLMCTVGIRFKGVKHALTIVKGPRSG